MNLGKNTELKDVHSLNSNQNESIDMPTLPTLVRSFTEENRRLPIAVVPPVPRNISIGRNSSPNSTTLTNVIEQLKIPPSTTSIVPIKNTKKTSPTQIIESGLGDVVISAFEKMKQLLGFTPNCLNGGRKHTNGVCECPEHFEGELCQTIVCLNNGTRVRLQKEIPQAEICRCPFPEYITGRHCETVHCRNGGKYLGNGHCECNGNWYSGQFCESYTSSWLPVVGIPFLFFFFFVLCCIVCRFDLCPRRSSRRRSDEFERRNRYGNRRVNNPRSAYNSRAEIIMRTQENLLNDAALIVSARRQPQLPSSVRIPPPLISQHPVKYVEPPPTYEQAIAASSQPSMSIRSPISIMPHTITLTDQSFRGQNVQSHPLHSLNERSC